MFNNNKSVFLALLTLAALLLRDGSGVAGHLNVFLNPEEVMRLLGKFPPPSLSLNQTNFLISRALCY